MFQRPPQYMRRKIMSRWASQTIQKTPCNQKRSPFMDYTKGTFCKISSNERAPLPTPLTVILGCNRPIVNSAQVKPHLGVRFQASHIKVATETLQSLQVECNRDRKMKQSFSLRSGWKNSGRFSWRKTEMNINTCLQISKGLPTGRVIFSTPSFWWLRREQSGDYKQVDYGPTQKSIYI